MGTTTKAKFGILKRYQIEIRARNVSQPERICIYNNDGKMLELSDLNHKWGSKHMNVIAKKCKELTGKPIIVYTYEKNNYEMHWTPEKWFYDVELDSNR